MDWDKIDRETWHWMTHGRETLPDGMHLVPEGDQETHTVLSPDGKTIRRYTIRRGADGSVVRSLAVLPAP